MSSLVLFVNKERSTNSPLITTTPSFELIENSFFRKKTPNYTANVRLDLSDDWTVGDIDPSKNIYRDYFERQRTPSEQLLSAYYMAEYRLDNQNTFTPIPCMIPFDVTFDLTSEMASNTPAIRTIYVKVSSINLSTTEKQQTLFTFTQNASTYLSSTAFAIEDVATKTLYTFIWGFSGVTTEIANLTSDVYYNVPSRVIFNMPKPGNQTVTQIVTSVYEKLTNFTEMTLITSNSSIHIIQTTNDRFLYPVSAYGSVNSRVIYPLLSTGVQHFSMSAIFLKEFPKIEHISYPSYVIDETRLPLTGTKITSSNFRQVCSANSFYGEGHAETINLSCNYKDFISDAPYVRWLIGNRTPKEINGDVYSPYYVDASSEDASTATVKINTNVVNSSYTLPVHAMLLDKNNYITIHSPIITYDDNTGLPSFYPFFSSSTTVEGDDISDSDLRSTNSNLFADPFKKSIEVMSYPVETQVEFKDPFFELYDTLPYNFDAKRLYSSVIFNPALTGILTERLVGTSWNMKATSIVGSWKSNAVTGPNTRNYVFELSYDKDYNTEFLPPFKASPLVDTTLLFEASCTKIVKIDFTNTVPASSLPPELLDWKEKTTVQYFGSLFEIAKPLSIKPYTKNYYNLKNVEVPFILHSQPDEPFILSAVELTSPLSQQTLKLTPQQPKGNIVFNRAGLVDLNMKIYLFDTISSTVFTDNVQFLDCLEILEEYDIIDENSLNSTLTPLTLSYTEPPLLSPNEWLIGDTVNDSIKKIYTVFEEINEFTTFYEKRDKLFAWFGLSQTPVDDAVLPEIKYTWQDLECVPVNGEEDETLSWFGFECNTPNIEDTTSGFKWSDHECLYPKDPSCMQRYCLEWSWKKRKIRNSPVKVTWGDTKRNGLYEKRWKFEKCELDSDILNCARIDWNVSYLNPRAFPIPFAASNTYCKFIDIEYLSDSDSLIVAHEREIRLLNNDLVTLPVYRRGIADELFSFQKIVGLAISSSQKIYVLDQILPRVCVFQVAENEILAVDSWGDYGLASNPTGFNKPTDIHIDQYDFIWIADNGNKCVKRYTATGKPVLTLTYNEFEQTPPLSMCLDVDDHLHVLTTAKVLVFDIKGNYIREYSFDLSMVDVNKINTNYNRQMVYISFSTGVAKYFKVGKICHYTIKDYKCSDNRILTNFGATVQDKHRNLYVIAVNKVLKFGDVMKTAELKGTVPQKSFWSLNEILVDKEEYVQPWVYLKAFHRLWDNIELLRSSLFFEPGTCREYVFPVYDKTDLTIGQNEIVTNAVINRLINQLWENLKFFINYFDPNCKK